MMNARRGMHVRFSIELPPTEKKKKGRWVCNIYPKSRDHQSRTNRTVALRAKIRDQNFTVGFWIIKKIEITFILNKKKIERIHHS
jgi:hypothetical protein